MDDGALVELIVQGRSGARQFEQCDHGVERHRLHLDHGAGQGQSLGVGFFAAGFRALGQHGGLFE